MNNFIQPGKTITCTAPTGGVTSGGGYLIGALFVVAACSVAETLPFEGDTEGVFALAKTTSQAWTEGQPAYWDVANAKASTNPEAGLPIGVITAAAGADDTSGNVRLNGVSLAGRTFSLRKRFTIAQVNSGASLVPAVPGRALRMVAASAIAVGGAVGATTTVDILGTQSASSVKLAAFAQASLTQNTELKAGGSGAAILAAGASYAACDAGAAITVGKTSSDITTATHIDFLITYSVE